MEENTGRRQIQDPGREPGPARLWDALVVGTKEGKGDSFPLSNCVSGVGRISQHKRSKGNKFEEQEDRHGFERILATCGSSE